MQYNYLKKSILVLFMLVMIGIDHASAQDTVKTVPAGYVSGKVFNQFKEPLTGVKVAVAKTTDTATLLIKTVCFKYRPKKAVYCK
jgi:hypothetical protein